MTTIYIPTYRRIGNQQTWKWLSPYWRDRAWLVAPEDEVDTLEAMGYAVIPCPDEVEGNLGRKRQWIIDTHDSEHLGDTIILADDDIRFAIRREDEPTKFRRLLLHSEFDAMMADLEEVMRTMAFGGIADRGGANRALEPYRMNARVNGLLALSTKVVRAEGIRVDRNLCMDDFDLGLQFLLKGYPNVVLNHFVKDYTGGSNAPGGCSTYRNKIKQERSAQQLKREFSAYVTLTERDSGWRGDMAGTRLDVRIQWAKAYEAGKELRTLMGIPLAPELDWSLGTLEVVHP